MALSALPAGRRNGYAHGGVPIPATQDSLSGPGGTAPAPDRPGPRPTDRSAGPNGATDAGTGRGVGPGRSTGVDPSGSDSGSGTGVGAGVSGRPASSAPRGTGAGRSTDTDGGAVAERGAPRQRLRAWAELLRVSALFSVPGDALAGAAAVGRRPGRGTALAIGASLCLYEAGMALNDWADRDEDAVDRPHRPIPSGRISPAAALGAAGALTAAGLALAARAGRPALTVATGLAATVWAYDLRLKHTKAGPAAMAAARSLDLLLGAVAAAAPGRAATAAAVHGRRGAPDNVAVTPGPAMPRGGLAAGLPALPAALVLGAHTYGVTAVSRHETQGGSTGTPLAVLATTTGLAAAVAGEWLGRGAERPGGRAVPGGLGAPGTATADTAPWGGHPAAGSWGGHPAKPTASGAFAGPAAPGAFAVPRPGDLLNGVHDLVRLLPLAFTGAYLRTAGPPLLHAALNPSPPLTQRAVGGGIRAMIPLQAALAARSGSPLTGLAVMGLVPLARTLARKVSLT
ncbi:SCO3242 family prenyltransferase [Streptomyces sp. NPDC049916]|uniref:SCO3242 family prenyltransferase n=1 Tax=Streptomyces sp. NPDC049916 TaxID=3155156 RepID=UPI003442B4CF